MAACFGVVWSVEDGRCAKLWPTEAYDPVEELQVGKEYRNQLASRLRVTTIELLGAAVRKAVGGGSCKTCSAALDKMDDGVAVRSWGFTLHRCKGVEFADVLGDQPLGDLHHYTLHFHQLEIHDAPHTERFGRIEH